MLCRDRTIHHSFDWFCLVWLFFLFLGNVIVFGFKVSDVVSVDCTGVWTRFMEINGLYFIINYVGSQRCNAHSLIWIRSFWKVESWITLDGLEHLSDFKSHQDDLIASFWFNLVSSHNFLRFLTVIFTSTVRFVKGVWERECACLGCAVSPLVQYQTPCK